MSFRRQHDERYEFLKRHGPELRACGVPDYITQNPRRFFLFLSEGFDEWGWAESRTSTAWGVNFLTPEQAGRLAGFITHHFGEEPYRDLLRELRQRASEPAAGS